MNQQETWTSSPRVAARAAGYTYRLQWAPGIEPAEADFREVNVQTRTSASTARSA